MRTDAECAGCHFEFGGVTESSGELFWGFFGAWG